MVACLNGLAVVQGLHGSRLASVPSSWWMSTPAMLRSLLGVPTRNRSLMAWTACALTSPFINSETRTRAINIARFGRAREAKERREVPYVRLYLQL